MRFGRAVLTVFLPFVLIACRAGGPAPAPLSPSFSVVAAPSSVIVEAGRESLAAAITVEARNGFAGGVEVEVTGLPAGIDAIPGPLLTLAPSKAAYLSLRASPTASGSATLLLRASSPGASDELRLPLTIIPRSVPASASGWIPVGADVRAIAYHEGTRQAFASVPDRNEVLVIDVPSQRITARLPIPLPTTVAVAPTGRTVWVGSGTEYAFSIEVEGLKLRRWRFPGATPTTEAREAQEIAPLFDGTVLVRTGWGLSNLKELARWDPQAGTVRRVDAPILLERMVAWSADGVRVAVADVGSLVVYDARSDSFTGDVYSTRGGFIFEAIFSPDGGRLAVRASTEVDGLVLLDADLRVVGTRPDVERVLTYDPTGSTLFLEDRSGRGIVAYDPLTCVDAGWLAETRSCSVPFVVGLPASGTHGAASESGQLLIPCEDGVRLANGNAALPSPPSIGYWGTIPRVVDPAQPTEVLLRDDAFPPTREVLFGHQRATITSLDVDGLRVIAPPSAVGGAVAVQVLLEDGSRQIAPAGFLYGPTLFEIFPNGGLPAGGNRFEARFEGLRLDEQPRFTVGGREAPGDGSIWTAPGGRAGYADVAIETPQGRSVIREGWQYLAGMDEFPAPAPIFQIAYDRHRRRLYASTPDLDQVQVFSLAEERWLTPIPVGPAPLGISLSPDGGVLGVAQFGDGTVTLLNPDAPGDRLSLPVLDPLDLTDDPRPYHVAAMADGRVFVGLLRTGRMTTTTEQRHLREIAPGGGVTTRLMPTSCEWGLIRLSRSPDGRRLAVSAPPSLAGSICLWEASADDFTAHARGGFRDVSLGRETAAVGWTIHDARMQVRALAPSAIFFGLHSLLVNDDVMRIHPEGTYLFVGGREGFWITDGHTGAVVRAFGLPISSGRDAAMEIDEWGRWIFRGTERGLAVIDLGQPPLGVGSVEPALAPSGAEVTLRGSGFASGAIALFDAAAVPTTFVDPNTLRAVLPAGPAGAVAVAVRGPDGRTSRAESLLVRRP